MRASYPERVCRNYEEHDSSTRVHLPWDPMSNPDCPRCHLPLMSRRTTEGHHWSCSECLGEFIPAAEVAPLLGAAVSMLRAPQISWFTRPLACPAGCGKMRIHQGEAISETVTIDICPTCRWAWFDVGEAACLRSSAEDLNAAAANVSDFARRTVSALDNEGASEVNGIQSRDTADLVWPTRIVGARQVRRPIWIWCTIVVCVAFFGVEVALGDEFVHRYSQSNVLILDKHTGVDRIVTALFLHANIPHIFWNMYFLWLVGRAVEDRLGRVVFPVFYLACGVAGGVALIVGMPGFTGYALGASGAISGVLAAHAVLFPNAKLIVRLPMFTEATLPSRVHLGLWFALQFIGGLTHLGNTGWWAHVGGCVAGLALALAAQRLLTDPRIGVVSGEVIRKATRLATPPPSAQPAR